MELETLKKDNKKKIEIGIIAVISITLVGVFVTSFAKYKNTESMSLAEGVINYKPYDFKIMAMYQQKEHSDCIENNCYDEIETMPSSGYVINESKSYCTLDNRIKDTNAILKTVKGYHTFSNLTKQDKCYLYFDIYQDTDFPILGNDTSSDITLAKLNLTANIATPNFSNIATTDDGIFRALDNDGISYYYRGSVTNNYLKFANKWWRIVRINGDGTIRIIYDGTAYHANGTSTTDSIAIANVNFNTNNDNNAYIGFQYTIGELRGKKTKSNAIKQLETWYTSNLENYQDYIDTNAGFCGDRTPYSGTGIGLAETYYAVFNRLDTNNLPILTCENEADLYTVQGAKKKNGEIKGSQSLDKAIGLITADETIMAGGSRSSGNSKYFLYNGVDYWTMSPWNFNSKAGAYMYIAGTVYIGYKNVSNTAGLRPVINLRSDVQITGSGTQNDPFVVN